jgi:hypothetical protein
MAATLPGSRGEMEGNVKTNYLLLFSCLVWHGSLGAASPSAVLCGKRIVVGMLASDAIAKLERCGVDSETIAGTPLLRIGASKDGKSGPVGFIKVDRDRVSYIDKAWSQEFSQTDATVAGRAELFDALYAAIREHANNPGTDAVVTTTVVEPPGMRDRQIILAFPDGSEIKISETEFRNGKAMESGDVLIEEVVMARKKN